MARTRGKREGRRGPRLRLVSINRLLPNVITVLALCAGLTSMRFALDGRWEATVLAIILAAALDGLDGQVARMLKGQTRFGAELDSLADFVNFGVAPSMALYLWVMDQARGFGWFAVLALSVCTALRLARYNSRLDASDRPPWSYRFFAGVPAPAGAGLALMPLMASFQFGDVVMHPVPVGVWTILVALLMVSNLPTFSTAGWSVPQRHMVPVLAGVGLIFALLASEPWLTMIVIAIAYLASLPFSLRRYRELALEEARSVTETSEEENGS
jgi:CDP-diacylglycerol--serine O-phosphatidyltransferase